MARSRCAQSGYGDERVGGDREPALLVDLARSSSAASWSGRTRSSRNSARRWPPRVVISSPTMTSRRDPRSRARARAASARVDPLVVADADDVEARLSFDVVEDVLHAVHAVRREGVDVRIRAAESLGRLGSPTDRRWSTSLTAASHRDRPDRKSRPPLLGRVRDEALERTGDAVEEEGCDPCATGARPAAMGHARRHIAPAGPHSAHRGAGERPPRGSGARLEGEKGRHRRAAARAIRRAGPGRRRPMMSRSPITPDDARPGRAPRELAPGSGERARGGRPTGLGSAPRTPGAPGRRASPWAAIGRRPRRREYRPAARATRGGAEARSPGRAPQLRHRPRRASAIATAVARARTRRRAPAHQLRGSTWPRGRKAARTRRSSAAGSCAARRDARAAPVPVRGAGGATTRPRFARAWRGARRRRRGTRARRAAAVRAEPRRATPQAARQALSRASWPRRQVRPTPQPGCGRSVAAARRTPGRRSSRSCCSRERPQPARSPRRSSGHIGLNSTTARAPPGCARCSAVGDRLRCPRRARPARPTPPRSARRASACSVRRPRRITERAGSPRPSWRRGPPARPGASSMRRRSGPGCRRAGSPSPPGARGSPCRGAPGGSREGSATGSA